MSEKSIMNNNIDTNKYKELYDKDNIVVINNFLNIEKAEQIYTYIHNNKPKNTWTSSVCYDNVKSDLIYKNSKKAQIQKNIKKATDAFNKNKFAFSFQRTLNNNNVPSIEGFTTYLFKNQSIIDKINEITSLNVERAHDIFISKYRFGDFLSPHCDKNNGRIAFVLNLTKNWKPQYGGILHIMNQDRTEIIRSIVPKFNSLVLFYIPPENGIPHFVSHININNNGLYRYAITGWFS